VLGVGWGTEGTKIGQELRDMAGAGLGTSALASPHLVFQLLPLLIPNERVNEEEQLAKGVFTDCWCLPSLEEVAARVVACLQMLQTARVRCVAFKLHGKAKNILKNLHNFGQSNFFSPFSSTSEVVASHERTPTGFLVLSLISPKENIFS